jgi:hypothetical protein
MFHINEYIASAIRGVRLEILRLEPGWEASCCEGAAPFGWLICTVGVGRCKADPETFVDVSSSKEYLIDECDDGREADGMKIADCAKEVTAGRRGA